jgi:hypothetical protein
MAITKKNLGKSPGGKKAKKQQGQGKGKLKADKTAGGVRRSLSTSDDKERAISFYKSFLGFPLEGYLEWKTTDKFNEHVQCNLDFDTEFLTLDAIQEHKDLEVEGFQPGDWLGKRVSCSFCAANLMLVA